MATFNKINDFVEHLAEKVHNLASDQLMVALSNTAPGSETTPPTGDGNGVLANVTELNAGAYTNLQGNPTSRQITTNSSSQTGGTYSLSLTDLTLTASGGAMSTFQYIYIYNDTPTAPANPLIGYYDYGSGLDLASGESLTIDFGANGAGAGNLFTLA